VGNIQFWKAALLRPIKRRGNELYLEHSSFVLHEAVQILVCLSIFRKVIKGYPKDGGGSKL
jgi:hypothetical protein